MNSCIIYLFRWFSRDRFMSIWWLWILGFCSCTFTNVDYHVPLLYIQVLAPTHFILISVWQLSHVDLLVSFTTLSWPFSCAHWPTCDDLLGFISILVLLLLLSVSRELFCDDVYLFKTLNTVFRTSSWNCHLDSTLTGFTVKWILHFNTHSVCFLWSLFCRYTIWLSKILKMSILDRFRIGLIFCLL